MRTKTAVLTRPVGKEQTRRRSRFVSIERLWEQYLGTRRVSLRNKIVVHYAPLVHAHAARLARKLPAQVSYDEIASAAFDGLIDAVEAYDPARKAKFETFCQQRISGAVMDWLRTIDSQRRTVRAFEKRRARVIDAHCTDGNYGLSDAELARRLNMGSDRYGVLARLSQMGQVVHFSAMEHGGGDAEGRHCSRHTFGIEDPRAPDPAHETERRMLAEEITKGLTRAERLILILYYYEEMSFREVGVVIDLSESRVCQMHKEILQRLRERLRVA